MTDPVVPPIRVERRGRDRREALRRDADRGSTALVPIDPPPIDPPQIEAEPQASRTPRPKGAADAAFAAQVMGQGGQRRGLKGGPPVMDHARGTYLGNEYSGEADRRPKPGGRTRTDV